MGRAAAKTLGENDHSIIVLARPDTAYLHAHNAGRGCYAARIDRS